jgi:prepilin-type N-terminal cleavage/methylation domain-containing protein
MMARSRRGVTLIEMLVVLTILGVMTSIAYPSITAGLDSVRLNAAADEAASLFTAAANFAERRQAVVEMRIAPDGIRLLAPGLDRRFAMPPGIAISGASRIVFADPSGNPPAVAMELRSAAGHVRKVRVDPVTGLAEVGS